MATSFPLRHGRVQAGDLADITFVCTVDAPLKVAWESVTPIYENADRVTGDDTARLYCIDGWYVLRFTDVGDFYLSSDQIICQPANRNDLRLIEIYLLGPALSFWYESRGVPTLHASAVVLDGNAVCFASHSGDGKSTLAANLMQAGYPLITDDILPCESSGGIFLGHPSYPKMRMWPDEAKHFLCCFAELERVHPTISKRWVPVGKGGFGAFCDAPKPLGVLYLPERRAPTNWGTDVRIEPVSMRDGVIELIRYSFTPHAVEAMGWQPRRIDFFAQLVKRVPVRRLTYPSGMEHLPKVRKAILNDLADL